MTKFEFALYNTETEEILAQQVMTSEEADMLNRTLRTNDERRRWVIEGEDMADQAR